MGQDPKPIIPAEFEVIPIETMKILEFDTESGKMTFSVDERFGGIWRINECQMWYVKQFAQNGLESVVLDGIDGLDGQRLKKCIAGTDEQVTKCDEFCGEDLIRKLEILNKLKTTEAG